MSASEAQKNEKEFVRLLFVGAPLLDITAHCGPEVLERYKLKLDDCVKATDEHQEIFQSLFNDTKSQLSAGGSSQNTARIAKWTLGVKAKISFVGCVGEDNFAARMSQRLQSEGVEPLYIPLSGESTGVCACLLDSQGERSMCARLGAAGIIKRHHLESEDILERLRQADCVFVEGYVFAHSPDIMIFLSKSCKEGQLFALSLSAAYICRDHTQTFLEVLPRVDVLLSNETEAIAMAKALGMPESTTVEEVACILATKGRPWSSKPRIVVVTRGSESVLLVQGAERPRNFAVPPGIQVLDSVGCGDAMAGAFLAVYSLTGDLSMAMRSGIKAAVEIAQVSGCNPTSKILYPLYDDIEILEHH